MVEAAHDKKISFAYWLLLMEWLHATEKDAAEERRHRSR